MQSIRELTEKNEHIILSPYAAFSDESIGRERDEEPCDIRTCFQRDRDRIIHSNAFRRLKHKSQVFLSPEAIALGHDLGHTPFGHAGERALNAVHPGGYRHYDQSVRVCEKLEKNGRGLNLSYEVINGIERHTNGEKAKTLEGRIVRLADRIAYINHDIDDSIRAGVMSEDDIDLSIRKVLGFSKSERINTLVLSAIENSEQDICLAAEVAEAMEELHSFMFAQVYTNPYCKGEEGKADTMLKQLYHYFADNPAELPNAYEEICLREGADRAACDYISGMTDRFAVRKFEELFIPLSWS